MDSSQAVQQPSSDSIVSSDCEYIQNIACVQSSELNKSLDELRNHLDEADSLLKQCTLSELQCDSDRIEDCHNYCSILSEPLVPKEYQLRSSLENELRCIAKESRDLMCDICSASPSSNTLMLHCDHCHFYMCGSCALTNPINHSIHCDHQMSYVNPSVPPKPPDDQLVPIASSVYSTPSTKTDQKKIDKDPRDQDAKDFLISLLMNHGLH